MHELFLQEYLTGYADTTCFLVPEQHYQRASQVNYLFPPELTHSAKPRGMHASTDDL